MRHAPITYDVFNASANANAAREAEFRAMRRRPDALRLPLDPAESSPPLGWLSRASRLLVRHLPAIRGRDAAG